MVLSVLRVQPGELKVTFMKSLRPDIRSYECYSHLHRVSILVGVTRTRKEQGTKDYFGQRSGPGYEVWLFLDLGRQIITMASLRGS